MVQRENNRKCFKCGCSPAEDNVKLFRFPKPGVKNLIRCSLWAKFVIPDKEYFSSELQLKLYNEHRMLCQKHFNDGDFRDHTKQKLLLNTVPYAALESGKRKHEDTVEGIRQIIQDYQNKLPRNTNNNGEKYSVAESSNDIPPETMYTESCISGDELDVIHYEDIELSPETPPLYPLSPQSGPSLPDQALPQTVLQDSQLPTQPGAIEVLDDDSFQILDDDSFQILDVDKEETSLVPPTHQDIVRRWQDILEKGLPDDVKDSLKESYLIPGNCDVLQAPALKPEVEAALPDRLLERDSSLSCTQQQLGIALSALASVTEMVMSNETSKQKLLKPLSDACRILCDSHYSLSEIRRDFVVQNVSEKLNAAPNPVQQSNAPSTSGISCPMNFVPPRKTYAKRAK